MIAASVTNAIPQVAQTQVLVVGVLVVVVVRERQADGRHVKRVDERVGRNAAAERADAHEPFTVPDRSASVTKRASGTSGSVRHAPLAAPARVVTFAIRGWAANVAVSGSLSTMK